MLHCTNLQSGSTAVVVRSNTRPAVVTVRSREALRVLRNRVRGNKQVMVNNKLGSMDCSDVHKRVEGNKAPHMACRNSQPQFLLKYSMNTAVLLVPMNWL